MIESKQNPTFWIWFSYVFFVVYGSLVPLDLRLIQLEQAWDIFQHIPMYQLGMGSRADWIANGVLYVPLGFLTAYLLIQRHSERRRIPLFILAAPFCVALAVSIEFVQIFFPPRTVSRNDLLAESIGSFIGLILAARYSKWLKDLLQAMVANPKRLTLRLLEVYLVGYVAFALFPYDIVLSGEELGQKLQGENWGWFLAGKPNEKILLAVKLFSEVILTIPFGLFLASRPASQPQRYYNAVFVGVCLGGLIEIAQFFTVSGVSQGVSVLTRIVGVCGGLALWDRRANYSPDKLSVVVRRYKVPLGIIYLLIVLQANGWFSHRWNGADIAISKLEDLHFLPFYYHYFTSESKAVVSLMAVCLTYFPIGLLTCSNKGNPAQAFVFAALAACVAETGKLFLHGLHPDPTNIMLAALASWGAVYFARMLSQTAAMPSTADAAVLQTPPINNLQSEKRTQLAGTSSSRWQRYSVLFPSLAFATFSAVTFPTQPALLSLFLLTCGAIIWRRPVLLFLIIPAALPVLDLAPWSGRFYLDEFDLLVLISLAIGYTRIPAIPRTKLPTDTAYFALACSLVAISFGIAAIRGLSPWLPPDANAFTNYYSSFNALRIVKGALFAFLIYGLLRRLVAKGFDVKRPFAWGLATGLFLTVAVTLWERVAFSGLFNFSSDYRITGPFSSMHTGGAYIECFLAIATPFLVLLVLQTRNWVGRLLGVSLMLATTYALMVTFSRNGYAAFGVALAIILFFVAFKSGQWKQRSILVAILSAAMLAVALPVFTGQFAQDRIATVGRDYLVRQSHWEDALNIRTPDLPTTLFGMGLGRYPESNYLLSRGESRSATYLLAVEGQESFLRLMSGSSIYIEQLVSVQPRQTYKLTLDARANQPGATITVPICEKWLLASYNCIWKTIDIGKVADVWQHFEIQVVANSLSISPWYSRRPIKLSLYSSNKSAIIDVDNIQLKSMQGDNLLINGDFSKEMDHWFFSADNHLQWHIKSFPVAVLFDQGWFGLLVLSMFSILAIKRAANRAWRGDLNAAAALASFCAFLVVGLFDTLIDAPRFLFLFLLLGWFCGSGILLSEKSSRMAN